MQIKIFTVCFDQQRKSFQDEELRHFLKAHNGMIERIETQYFVHAGSPYYAVFVIYHESQRVNFLSKENISEEEDISETKETKNKQRTTAENLLDDLHPRDVELYELLRQWRNLEAEAKKVPAYILFNNKQLILIAKQKSSTLTNLTKIPGIGKIKTEKYGREILNIIENFRQSRS